ncbi:Cytidine and deoxycytidylate deaminase zinc-binding domain containing protein [Cladophialophora carrionii]|uniref:Cytidine and deoxycytidylate deaminase zinc-binding domain containing protein n=1 Tax=Cladophialophora carrionii TaxID=86049 RepID=A0A1C1C742_9EURO|nr:Cytidine and deoxycytidylate deaminase zinc-binding domain containing protein [Cladophialophora carrionii]
MSPPGPTHDTGPSTSTHLHYLRQCISLARLSPPKSTNFRVGCVIVSFPAIDSSRTVTGTGTGTGTNTNAEDALPKGDDDVLSTGFTLELEGNTHAEQNALTKLARDYEDRERTQGKKEPKAGGLGAVLTPQRNVHLYTSLEPCGLRLSGATPCVQRIIATREDNPDGGIRKVVFGAREPGTFVQDSQALKMLDDAGVPWEHVAGLEAEILAVAKEGHHDASGSGSGSMSVSGRAGSADGDSGATAVVGNTPAPPRATNVDDISPEERKRQEQQPRNPKKRMMEVDLSR